MSLPDPSTAAVPDRASLRWIVLGIVPILLVAAFGVQSLWRESDLARFEARTDAVKRAQTVADLLSERLLARRLPTVADIEAWRSVPGAPSTEPLAAIAGGDEGVLAFLRHREGSYPEQTAQPIPFSEPGPGSDLARAWEQAERLETAGGASRDAAAAWESVLALAAGSPTEALAQFRAGAARLRLGETGEALKHLEPLAASRTPAAGVTGLPVDVLAYRALLQMADLDPALAVKRLGWFDGFCERVLLHWRLPAVLLEDASGSAAMQERREQWQRAAHLHGQARVAFADLASVGEETGLFWKTNHPGGRCLIQSRHVADGRWHLLWPEAVLEQAMKRELPALNLPEYLGLRVQIAGRELGAESAGGEPLAAADSAGLPGFGVVLTLVHPEILEGRLRRRVWVFGALILLGTGAAMVALVGAIRAFERQRQLALQQSEFVAAVSHELRAPLAAVRLLAEELVDLPGEESGRRMEYHRLILREARRLGLLVDNVLQHARGERRRLALDRVRIDAGEIVALAAETLRPTAQERQITVAVKIPDQPVEGLADPQALTQVVVNLLDNALKHAPAGSTVDIELRVGPEAGGLSGLILGVRDRGPGIPRPEQDRIFEAFVRRGSELRRETPGVGLGLAIVRRLVTAHGGRVRVESEPGQGALFVVELPWSSPAAGAP